VRQADVFGLLDTWTRGSQSYRFGTEIMSPFARSTAVLLILAAGAACRTASVQPTAPIIQPGAPGQAGRTIASGTTADLPQPRYTAADVTFMQGMIHHHAQALDMTALLSTRTSSADMRKLGLRIQVSQTDEIKMMQRWLEARGQAAPDPHAMHMPGMVMPGMDPGPMMPGMLTPAEMANLAELKGVEFDRVFLTGMIRHHGGALTMVQELFASPGAGQESEIFGFASDVDADQRMEIDRMGAMLRGMQT
jgi:uncharacterized protein (DUF305 family)